MNLIHFRGLNCHLSAIVNIVDALGINYNDAFCTLWSETDFAADNKYNLYLSKRVIPNLEALGINIEALDCGSRENAEQSFCAIRDEELFLIGIDTYYIPWNLFYQNFYEPHYFFARKENSDSIFCFDSFNNIEMRLAAKDIVPNAFDLSRIHKFAVDPMRFSLAHEAQEVLRKLPEMQEKMCAEMHRCKNKDYEIFTPLIKQITAMINNRHLFQHFLHQYHFAQNQQFFDRDFFMKWDAVKNGTHKIYVMKDNERVIEEACGLFVDLVRQETEMATSLARNTYNV